MGDLVNSSCMRNGRRRKWNEREDEDPVSMPIRERDFETLHPSRFAVFILPFPSSFGTICGSTDQGDLLRVAVLDSSLPPSNPPEVAAMLVPDRRETHWVFSTESGHLQLISNFPFLSRLIIIGRVPDKEFPAEYKRPSSDDVLHRRAFESSLKPLVHALYPKSALRNTPFEIPFLVYEDGVVGSVIVERCFGPCAGEMIVDDVEIESFGLQKEFRRRLIFKRMPNLVQTEVRILPDSSSPVLGDGRFLVDNSFLVHQYLQPMVGGLSLLRTHATDAYGSGVRPRALCLGVGGGALLSFLNTQLGFEVIGVEADLVVLRLARQYFGLEENETVKVFVADGIAYLHELSCRVRVNREAAYDVLMVDLDGRDARNGVSAPPLEFIDSNVLSSAKRVLSAAGVLIINSLLSSREVYEHLTHELRTFFDEIYQIDVGNGENFVVVATTITPQGSVSGSRNCFLQRLSGIIPWESMDIKKILH